jgi:hypothetical protein
MATHKRDPLAALVAAYDKQFERCGAIDFPAMRSPAGADPRPLGALRMKIVADRRSSRCQTIDAIFEVTQEIRLRS